MEPTLIERLAVIENNQENFKEIQNKQTQLLEAIHDKFGTMQSNVSVHDSLITTLQANVSENKARGNFIPNIILTVVVTAAISFLLSQPKILASENPTQAQLPTQEKPQPRQPEITIDGE